MRRISLVVMYRDFVLATIGGIPFFFFILSDQQV